MRIDDLNKLVTRTIATVYIWAILTIPVLGVLALGLYDAHNSIQNIAKNMPIMVVPGAVAGVYTAGLSDDTLINSGRYFTNLISNFTRQNVTGRLDELERFVDNTYTVGFKNTRVALLREIDQQSQGRAFSEVSGAAQLKQDADGTYVFTTRGDRTFFSAGIVLYEDQADVEFRFKLGSPSSENKYGINITGVEVREVPGSKRTN